MELAMDRNERHYILMLSLIYLMPIMRIVFDLLIGNYTVVTIAIYPIALIILFFINGGMKPRIRKWTLLFIVYIIIVSVFHVIAGSSSFIQAISSVMRFMVLALSVNYVTFAKPSYKGSKRIARLTFVFFGFTIVASIIQMIPAMPLHNMLLSAGGNMVSSTALLNVRANGAVGGTVIAYGVYIVICSFFLVLGVEAFNSFERVALFVGIIAAMFMNYSRACFVGVAGAFAGYFFLFKFRELRVPYKLLSICMIFAFCWWYLSTDNIMVRYIFQGDIYRSVSDGKRIESSIAGLGQMDTFAKQLFGISAGQNTGFSAGGKILGDGAIVSILLDYGGIGLLLFLSFLIETLVSINRGVANVGKKALITIVYLDLITMLLINSGFLENINIMLFSYPIYLFVYCLPSYKPEEI